MSKELRLLQIMARHQDCQSLTVFLTIKTSQNISIMLLQILLKFTNIEATIGEKSSRKRF